MFVIPRILLTAILLAPAAAAQGAPEKSPASCPKGDKECVAREMRRLLPVVTVVENNAHWLGDVGATATLSLYGDGRIVYLSGRRYMEAQLTLEEIEQFMTRVRGIDCITWIQRPTPDQKNPPFPVFIDLTHRMPRTTVSYFDPVAQCGGTLRLAGTLRLGYRRDAIGFSNAANDALLFLASYRHPRAAEILPEKWLVSFTLLDKEKPGDVQWPDQFPKPSRSGIPNLLEMQVNHEEYLAMKDLVGRLAKDQYIAMNGQRWLVGFTPLYNVNRAADLYFIRGVPLRSPFAADFWK